LVGLGTGILWAEIAILLGGFAYAAAADWRAREVTDLLWQAMGALGLILGAALVAPGGPVPLGLWLLVAAFAWQHMFPWTLGKRLERYEDVVDLGLYVTVTAVVIYAAFRLGVGPGTVPFVVVALLVTVLFARGLFEAGLLFGGADAKAVMVAGILLPIFASPLVVPNSASLAAATFFPYPVNLVMNAALLSVAIPIALLARNLVRGERHGWGTFTGYTIPVEELPHRFVWVRNPMSREARAEEDEIETSEQDRLRRVRVAAELAAQGTERVWVTPQIPYVVVLAAGALAGLLAGNLVIDLITLA
jgi:archaeal preflagellin peptidase FlaK